MRIAAALAVALLMAACGGDDGDGVGLDEHELVVKGDKVFHGAGTCAVCHGDDLRGTPMGPSFLEPIYAPSTLPDQAFHDAVRNGVAPKNWELGAMPALPHVSDADVEAIVAYVRSVQRENGIR